MRETEPFESVMCTQAFGKKDDLMFWVWRWWWVVCGTEKHFKCGWSGGKLQQWKGGKMIIAYNTEQSMEEGKNRREWNSNSKSSWKEGEIYFLCPFFVLLHASLLLFFVHRLSVSNMVCIKWALNVKLSGMKGLGRKILKRCGAVRSFQCAIKFHLDQHALTTRQPSGE